MSKTEKLSAKEVAAMCDMTPKNFRKHLREKQLVANHERTARYAFTSKQAEKIVASLAANSDEDVEVTE